MESVERRVLLSAGTIAFSSTSADVIVSGTTDADVAEVFDADADHIRVRIQSGVDVVEQDFLRSDVSRIVFDGSAGNDRFENRTDIRSVANGGDGHDTLIGGGGRDLLKGHRGHDWLAGGDARDTLKGYGGRDTLLGEGGNDRLLGSGGNDALEGGEGNDLLRGQGGNDGPLLGESGDDVVEGGPGDDRLGGGEGDDSLGGDEGIDLLEEGADVDFRLTDQSLNGLGADILTQIEHVRIYGGISDNRLDADGFTGEVTLFGAAGNDTLIGGSEGDLLSGGNGDDSIEGRAGDDRIRGGAGNDCLLGGEGADWLHGGGHDDFADGQQGSLDTVIGGHGNDSLYGGEGNDLVRGGDGDDFLDGGAGDDSIDGQAGSDALLGQDGDDVLNGMNQPDLLIGGPGADELHGGNYQDLLIGGSTLFDADHMSLGWIMSAWKLPGTTYHNRIALLTDPDSVYRLQSGHSVMDDQEIDELFGEADLDWLFQPGPYGSSTWDSLSDLSPNEQIDLSISADGPLSDQIVWPPLSLPQPDYLEPLYDPIFGTQITRITGDYGVEFTVPTNTGGSITKSWSSVIKNRYTTDSPWNIDGSLIHLRSFDPIQPYQVVLNGGTLEPELIAFLPNTNFRWSVDPARPNIQYSLIQRITDPSLDDIIYEYDVTNAVITKTIDLPFNKFYSGKEVIAFVDGKQYVAVAGVDELDPSTGIHVYIVNLDHAEGESPVVASFPLDVQPGGTMDPADWTVNTNTLTSSPDGRHVLVMYDGPTAADVAWRLLDVDLSGGGVTPHELPADHVGHALSSPADPALGFFPVNWGHPVFGYGADGDVYVVGGSGRWQGEDVPGVVNLGAGVGGVLSFNPRTDTYQSLTDPDDEAKVSHVTATNYDRPGWVFVSYRTNQGGEMYRGEIVALNLDAPGDPVAGMKRLGHHQSNEVDCYQCQPHLVANRDGTRLIVSSTWGPEQAVVSSYLLEFELPEPA